MVPRFPPLFILLLRPLLLVLPLSFLALKPGQQLANNDRSHSPGYGQPWPGLADSTTLHGSAATPKLNGGELEKEEELELVTREAGIWSHREAPQMPRVWVYD